MEGGRANNNKRWEEGLPSLPPSSSIKGQPSRFPSERGGRGGRRAKTWEAKQKAPGEATKLCSCRPKGKSGVGREEGFLQD